MDYLKKIAEIQFSNSPNKDEKITEVLIANGYQPPKSTLEILEEKRKLRTNQLLGEKKLGERNKSQLLPYIEELMKALVELNNETYVDEQNGVRLLGFNKTTVEHQISDLSFKNNYSGFEFFIKTAFGDKNNKKVCIWLNNRVGAHVHNRNLEYSCYYGGDYRKDLNGIVEAIAEMIASKEITMV